ncbi:NAD(P)-binding domain-containing protein [Rhodococcus erythropolis]|uniref:NADPH-dependent F420 reductase n=1 Tax=Rhodococcus erythropolis TaxID=1833 RepID=UPI002949CFAF|nr:NAD(P)-binding domain-containing protein [Rhodococcus erythropolis]MDV6212804.1 NAD(P)-binding domain-containing protein [Rhodococcus erythropolis]
MTTIGILGAGPIGRNLAAASAQLGHDVLISNSRGPDTLGDLAELGSTVRAATSSEAAMKGEIVIAAIQPAAIPHLPVSELVGKVVLDTCNYYPRMWGGVKVADERMARDSQIPELDDESTTVSELLQAHLEGARVVKAFNHLSFEHIVGHASPTGTPGRRALAIAGDDADGKRVATEFIDAVGFDVVDLGPLSEGWRVQRGTPAYIYRFDAGELTRRASEARRFGDLCEGELGAMDVATLRYLGYLYM